MITYYKKTINDKIIGLGYLDEAFPNNMQFEDYEQSEYFELEEISKSEFLKLGRKFNFTGIKTSNTILPSSYFSELSSS